MGKSRPPPGMLASAGMTKGISAVIPIDAAAPEW